MTILKEGKEVIHDRYGDDFPSGRLALGEVECHLCPVEASRRAFKNSEDTG